jgi:hypothetical protein
VIDRGIVVEPFVENVRTCEDGRTFKVGACIPHTCSNTELPTAAFDAAIDADGDLFDSAGAQGICNDIVGYADTRRSRPPKIITEGVAVDHLGGAGVCATVNFFVAEKVRVGAVVASVHAHTVLAGVFSCAEQAIVASEAIKPLVLTARACSVAGVRPVARCGLLIAA